MLICAPLPMALMPVVPAYSKGASPLRLTTPVQVDGADAPVMSTTACAVLLPAMLIVPVLLSPVAISVPTAVLLPTAIKPLLVSVPPTVRPELPLPPLPTSKFPAVRLTLPETICVFPASAICNSPPPMEIDATLMAASPDWSSTLPLFMATVSADAGSPVGDQSTPLLLYQSL